MPESYSVCLAESYRSPAEFGQIIGETAFGVLLIEIVVRVRG